ncbi:MAG: hypothetical protein EPO20_11305 [Betaproteobacteria bacterium]|nr:MAG: hypothetical protein EPO20_11305 [Betaproteobacteria bacterium]
MVFTLAKKTARLLALAVFLESVGWSLAGPFRQQAGEIKEEAEEEPVRHRLELKHSETGFGKSLPLRRLNASAVNSGR